MRVRIPPLPPPIAPVLVKLTGPVPLEPIETFPLDVEQPVGAAPGTGIGQHDRPAEHEVGGGVAGSADRAGGAAVGEGVDRERAGVAAGGNGGRPGVGIEAVEGDGGVDARLGQAAGPADNCVDRAVLGVDGSGGDDAGRSVDVAGGGRPGADRERSDALIERGDVEGCAAADGDRLCGRQGVRRAGRERAAGDDRPAAVGVGAGEGDGVAGGLGQRGRAAQRGADRPFADVIRRRRRDRCGAAAVQQRAVDQRDRAERLIEPADVERRCRS